MIADGRTKQRDCGRLELAAGESQYFLGIMSVGFDSQSERTSESDDMAPWPNAISWQRRQSCGCSPLQKSRSTASVNQTAMLVAIGNSISYGGGMKICPDAVQDDGVLDMTVLGAVSKAEVPS